MEAFTKSLRLAERSLFFRGQLGMFGTFWYCERLWAASCYFFEELGEDIREGKITYPVTLARGSGQSSWPMLKMTCPEEFYKRMESCLSVGRGDEQVGKGEAKIRVEDAATENP